MVKFETIKNEEFKIKVDNIIDKVLFSKFYRPTEILQREQEKKEVEALLELVKDATEKNSDLFADGGLAQGFVFKFEEFLENDKIVANRKKRAYDLEDELFDEINEHFKEDHNGYRTYDVEYFENRINIFTISGFTENFTNEEKMLQENLGFKTKKGGNK